MSETYTFDVMMNVKGTIRGYSKRDAILSLSQLVQWSKETFEDSLPGRLDDSFTMFGVKGIPTVPKAPKQDQVMLPDSRMWMP
jgi:hypothetical protein